MSEIEIITYGGRRRRWSASEKMRIVEETLEEGTSINVAASSEEKRVPFVIVGALSGANGVVEAEGTGGADHVIEVPAWPLDTIFPGRSLRLAIKIDVEGHEMSVLDGAEATLTENKCLIQFEDYSENALSDRFSALGYKEILRIGPDPSHGAPTLTTYCTTIHSLDVHDGGPLCR
jgi:FkbM family methyltransferase